jgi:hypothetical protein
MVMLYKSCSVSHRSPAKWSLHFSDFSTIFYGFYKNQQHCKHYFRNILQGGPCKFLKPYRNALALHLGPWKELIACNWVP